MITRHLYVRWTSIFVFFWTFFAACSNGYHFESNRKGILASPKLRNILTVAIVSTGMVLDIGCRHVEPVHAATYQSAVKERGDQPQSPGWEASRQKRTAAMKAMQIKGIIKIDTDDSGNQYLKLPWLPDRQMYKSLSITQRLQGEVCAGAIGELSKDILLHAVDTAKTRKQAMKKGGTSPTSGNTTTSLGSAVSTFKDFYAGFPIVLASSIPQGGVFFLVKKGIVELLNKFAPTAPSIISTTIPIGFGVMAYWIFRTPTEVIKTQVQTYQSPSCKEALKAAKSSDTGILSLWKHYNVMLFLDVPFQMLNFVLLGVVSDAVLHAGFETSILTRLFCGVTCGMITAAVTCPIDVCKTRIISRDRKAASAQVPPMLIDVEGTVLGGEGSFIEVDGVTGREDDRIAAQPSRREVYSIDDGSRNRDSRDSWASGQMAVEVDGSLRAERERQSAGTLLLTASPKVSTTRSDSGYSESVSASSPEAHHTTASSAGAQTDSAANNFSNVSNVSDVSDVNSSNIERSNETPYQPSKPASDNNVVDELFKIVREEGVGTLFLGIKQRLLYVGLANGIRLAAYGTSRMDLMMRSLDDL